MNNYEVVILCGKSGAGKNYLLQKMKDHFKDDLNYIISDTTRPKRYKEIDGEDYHFISDIQFHTKKYLEKTSYRTEEGVWNYGTPLSALDPNKVNIGIFSINGIKQLFTNCYIDEDIKLHIYYISADDKTRLLRQLNREEYPNCLEICRRFLADEKDFKNLYKYPFRKIRNSSGLIDDQCAAVLIEEIDQIKADFDKMN